MTNDYLIRLATHDDVQQIVTHRRRMFEDMGNQDTEGLDRMVAAFGPWVADHLASGLYKSWFACTADGTVAAGTDAWLQDWPAGAYDTSPYRAYLLNVYTDSEHRRKGLARLLVKTCMDWCYANDIRIVTLHASDQGRNVYESLGFTPTNEMRTWKDR
ncbi:MAG: GNAT family N-acetyltransferase [Chloroflexi bacterium]|nr:GNAT family N-acetyltransferase [Chloroflexota bacterium]MCC6894753.1 GNAT family N-acetyltransferase [Anaerolineae bacterium]